MSYFMSPLSCTAGESIYVQKNIQYRSNYLIICHSQHFIWFNIYEKGKEILINLVWLMKIFESKNVSLNWLPKRNGGF